MLIGAIAGAEMAMRDAGIAVEAGAGVAAAEESFRAARGGIAPWRAPW